MHQRAGVCDYCHRQCKERTFTLFGELSTNLLANWVASFLMSHKVLWMSCSFSLYSVVLVYIKKIYILYYFKSHESMYTLSGNIINNVSKFITNLTTCMLHTCLYVMSPADGHHNGHFRTHLILHSLSYNVRDTHNGNDWSTPSIAIHSTRYHTSIYTWF